MNNFSNLIIRWTFGETKERPTSLQAFDMLECSVLFAKKIFPKAERYIIYNSLKTVKAFDRLVKIAEGNAKLIEAKASWNNFSKNSFWKYIPLRIDKTKYELILDSDIVLWKMPKTIHKWLFSKGLLINSDWNGQNYGDYSKIVNTSLSLNAGIIGYPPFFEFKLPNISNLKDKFLSEQGYIVNKFLSSNLQLFILSKNEIFQSNAKEHIDKKVDNITVDYYGSHFCGCNYCHYQHWDKFYKDDIWEFYYNKKK